MKSVAAWLGDKGMSVDELEKAAGLDRNVLNAICLGRYLPSPQQRQRIAAALSVAIDEITWGHTTPIQHIYGHGPQFGRSP
jgi:transcriptional regulator with XRE-family HTH domain